ncbi:hypothetical protein OHU17_16800 [Streptomyces goshikiensis]|uniref:Uncharacterized protein n=1 Tax=Streptomyces goshikiensis TaxID=1942 RepID=A0ABZ1RKY0_9ACTN|nr:MULTISPECIES: hypothetical protein [Streptomyces]EDX25409.1 hypothetical protein SSAG_05251 [Streptomyces sp. Mg1]MBP0935476.1 hypothetical protein [Streptomyces sp. KCTC 0041BP]MBT1183866.1 hypothetical protein [Streptomyces sp. CJ_13]WBY21293.1 hypothetical protein PET44_17785 [Streptomyces goshikiensis]WSS00089.1 hypothetical protein OG224_19745 [Streptomyces goshikiensis]
MGWTHDYGDTAHEGRSAATPGTHERAGRDGHDPRLGIPRILRRRARWVSARLRHPRM